MRKIFSIIKEHPFFMFFIITIILLSILAATVSRDTYDLIGHIIFAVIAAACWTLFFMTIFPLKQLMEFITDYIFEKNSKRLGINDSDKNSIEFVVMLITAIVSFLLLLYPCYLVEIRHGWG